MAPTSRLATLRRLWRLTKPFFFSDVRWQARGLLLLSAVSALSIAGLNVLVSYTARDFMNSFALREKDEFIRNLVLYILLFAITTPVSVLDTYSEQRLALLWRRWLSREMLTKYFNRMSYYKVAHYEGIDNPDQRLEEDVRSFTATTLSLFLIFFKSLLNLFFFVQILWSISINLIIGVFAYALLGSVITYFIGRPLIALNFSQLKKEADYRYKLVNVRDHAESIAFYSGDRLEKTRARQRLKKALRNFLRIINLNRNIGLFVNFYNNVKPLLPIIIVAPLFFSEQIQLGVVTQAADAFVRVTEALSLIIQHFATISAVTAVVTRLGSFSEALEDLASPHPAPEHSHIAVQEGTELQFHGVTIMTPRRDLTLVRNLSFAHKEGGLLITGPSGSGKTSIFRVIKGLWNEGTGFITRPPLAESHFIPQRPYLVLGTLRDVLLYAVSRRGLLDSELVSLLQSVGLDTLLERIDNMAAVADWNSFLSAGEQQQLAIARLLISRPKAVFLDEATTAVDAETEKRLYSLVMETASLFVSIGFNTNLRQYHRHVLELRDDGSWSFYDT